MSEPKVYFITPLGWTGTDKLLSSVINPVGVALDKFEQSGYRVIKKDGCTQDEFLQIVSRPDTYGFIVASHGQKHGVFLDLPQSERESRRRVGNEDLPEDTLFAHDITARVSRNLQFAVFFGCDLSEDTLAQYADKLGLPRAAVRSTTAPYDGDYSFNLGLVIEKAFDGLSLRPRSPDAGPGPRDAGPPPAGVAHPRLLTGLRVANARPTTPRDGGLSSGSDHPSFAPAPRPPFVFTKWPPNVFQQADYDAMRRAAKSAQRFAREAAIRAQENARHRAGEQAKQRRESEESQRRAREEAERRRVRSEAQRRRSREETQRRAQSQTERRQQAMDLASIRPTGKPIVRFEVRGKPTKTSLPRVHDMSMTFPPHTIIPRGGSPKISTPQGTVSWKARW